MVRNMSGNTTLGVSHYPTHVISTVGEVCVDGHQSVCRLAKLWTTRLDEILSTFGSDPGPSLRGRSCVVATGMRQVVCVALGMPPLCPQRPYSGRRRSSGCIISIQGGHMVHGRGSPEIRERRRRDLRITHTFVLMDIGGTHFPLPLPLSSCQPLHRRQSAASDHYRSLLRGCLRLTVSCMT